MQVTSESVCAFVYRRRGQQVEFLLLHRIPARGGFWQSVSGRIESSEKADAAARREVREETGLTPIAVHLLEKVNVFYNAPIEAIHLEPCFGIEVRDEPVQLSSEHDAHRWVEYPEARRLIPYAGVRAALDELRDHLGAGS